MESSTTEGKYGNLERLEGVLGRRKDPLPAGWGELRRDEVGTEIKRKETGGGKLSKGKKIDVLWRRGRWIF
jgi:hypothetical protein